MARTPEPGARPVEPAAPVAPLAPSLAWLLPILAGALIVRVFFLVVGPFFLRPDEVFQALEPAHRLLTGHGAITWEWHEGIRSWLFPGLIAIPMAGSAAIGLGHSVIAVQAACATLSLVVVVTAARFGQIFAGSRGALLCGVLTAVWPDTVLDGAHTLTETQGGNLLAVATMLASIAVREQRPRTMFRSPLAIGLLLGGSVILRFQLLPGVAVVLAVMSARRRGAASAALIGVALPIALQAVLDTLTLGWPLQSMWKNLSVNLGAHRSDLYGTMSPLFYLSWMVQLWGAAFIPIAACFIAGVRATKLAAIVVAAVVLSHSLIPHKEFTFIAGAIPLVLVTAGVGLVRLLDRLELAFGPRAEPVSRPSFLVLGLIALSLCTIFSGYKPVRRAHADLRLLMRHARTVPQLCGLALDVGEEQWWDWTGGYSVLDRDVPVYLLRTPTDLAQASTGFNAMLVAEAALAFVPTGYRLDACHGGTCLIRRPGVCFPNNRHLLQDATELGLPTPPGQLLRP